MKIYATREETEMIKHCLYLGATYADRADLPKYLSVIGRLEAILASQCPADLKHYTPTTTAPGEHTDC